MIQQRLPAVCAIALFVGATTSAFAQSDYPSRTVTIVSPVATGGTYSAYARIVGAKLEDGCASRS